MAADKHKQAKVVDAFVRVYCRRKHALEDDRLCEACADLLAYARDRLTACPLDPKPKCKDCHVHCYAEPYRSRIKAVMKFSGMHFVKRGRLDWLLRYFFSR